MTSPHARSPKDHTSRGAWIALALVLVTALLHGATARPTHPWSGVDDFSAYLLHGRNLLADAPYDDLGDLRDPSLPRYVLREAFPPVFPWLLAHLDAALATPGPEGSPLGIPVLGFKRVQALVWAASLFLWFLVFRRLAGDRLALLTLAVLCSSAFLFHAREFVRSEAVFSLLAAGALLVANRLDQQRRTSSWRWPLALLLGSLGWLAYGTRTAGIVLPLALVTHELWLYRRVRAPQLLAVVVMVVGMLVQGFAFGAVVGGYLDYAGTNFGPSVMLDNARQYSWQLQRMLAEGLPGVITAGSLLIAAGLAAVGLASRLRRPSLAEVFVAGTMAMHILLPTLSAWQRYLIPLLPVFVLLALVGARWLGARFGAGHGLATTAAVALVALGVPGWLSQPWGALPDGPGTPAAREALHWIETRAAPDDVVGTRKPWPVRLATGRPTLLYPLQHVLPDLPVSEHLAHLERMQVRWLLLRHRPLGVVLPYNTFDYDDRAGLEQIVRPHPERFVERARNDEFVLYEIVQGRATAR